MDGAVNPHLLYAFKVREGKTLSLCFREWVLEPYSVSKMVLVVVVVVEVAAVGVFVCVSTIFNQIKCVQESCWEHSDFMA